jgi:hypothetical protein
VTNKLKLFSPANTRAIRIDPEVTGIQVHFAGLIVIVKKGPGTSTGTVIVNGRDRVPMTLLDANLNYRQVSLEIRTPQGSVEAKPSPDSIGTV